MQYWAMFAGGVLGSAHCVGMCGGFALAIGATKPPFWATLVNQLVYSAGRIFTYTFLGAVVGAIGLYIGHWRGTLVEVQRVMSIVAGVAMLLVGSSVLFGLGLERLTHRWPILTAPVTRMAKAFTHLLNGRTRWSFFLAGLFTGFLPCGLVYAFVALAMSRGTVEGGALTMTAFGLGTVPAMVLIGCGGWAAGRTTRVRVHRVAAFFVVVLGFATVARALPFFPCHWLPTGAHLTTNACHCQ